MNQITNQKKLSETPTVHPSAKVTRSEIGKWTDIGANSKIVESTIGDYSYTAGDVQIIYASVGKFCSIASHVRINPGNHPTWRVTQHHATYRRVQYGFGEEEDHEFFEWRKNHPVTIGHDVWIGHNAVIMPGVTVGNGAVIGAGAIVTKDVEPYSIVAGVPAKKIKERFPRTIAEQLDETAWWDWSREELEERFPDLNDLDLFLARYGKGTGGNDNNNRERTSDY
ncbi:hypothetical protein SAMN04487944_102108 [Gracilibacillus ureilyticus]|uniref:Phosphonate metabolim protein, transferase hexapeptide repeat family n=1 Tax=Gracilibacillus ureilyticus TaxID=531814 RepID=A0A1H9MQI2_9BACI|nr:DapH/DapD/GlmU-related protein [Gracilibacillus ureilyticus]SER25956.1 hypothetical protein SAMN04487944_102108 [Gracilibacillus ureilyticus]